MKLHHLGSTVLLLALALGSCGESGGTPPVLPPVALSYPGSGFDLEPDQPITPIAPAAQVGGGAWTVTPALPTGLSLDPGTGVISGTPTGYVRRSLHEVTVENASGSASTWLTFRVGGEARFAYASSRTDGAISEFGVRADGGELFSLGWIGVGGTLANPLGAAGLAVDEDGEVLCRVNDFDLACFTIDGASGRLDRLPVPDTTNRVSLSTGPHAVAIRPDGRFVFVTSGDSDRVRTYEITQATGALVQRDEKTTDAAPTRIACDPHGRYVAVLHAYDDTEGSEGTTVRSYAVVPGTGQLVLPQSLELEGVRTTALAYDPVGLNLYVAGDLPSGRIHHFRVDPVTGTLTARGSLGAGTEPVALSVSPDGRFVHAVDRAGARVLIFRVDLADGSLTATGSYAVGGAPEGLAHSFDGAELHVLDPSLQELQVLAVDAADGELSPGSLRRVRAGTNSLVQVAGASGLQPRAVSLVSAGEVSQDVRSFLIDPATGRLDDQGLAPIATIGVPTGVMVDPRGRFAFVACRSGPVGQQNTVESFPFDAAGHVQDTGVVSIFPEGTNLGATPGWLRGDPGGRLLYTPLPETVNDILAVLPIDPSGSVLDQSGGAVSLPEARGEISEARISPSMQYLYLAVGSGAQFAQGELQVLQVAATNGRTGESPLLVLEAQGFPSAIAFDPTGRFAYVTLRDSNLVQAYSVDLDGGLTPIGPGSATRDEPVDVELTEDGRFAYVVCADTDAVGQLLLYDVDPTTHELINGTTLAREWRETRPAGTPCTRVLLPPGGGFLHVLDQGLSRVVTFTTDAEGVPSSPQVDAINGTPTDADHLILLE